MAKLVKCKACSADISKTAKTCPQCGAKGAQQYSIGSLIVVTLLVVFIYSLVTSNDKPVRRAAPNQATVSKSSSPEAKLAAIDSGSASVPNSVVRNYADRLSSLEGKCHEPRERLADFAVVGVKALREGKGVNMSLLRFLSAMDGSMPPSMGSTRCQDIAASLVAMIDR